jgi:hemerythrin superfamily protein
MGTARTSQRNNKTIDILELLETQHREVDALLEQLEQRKGDLRAAFTELADKLAAHSTVEERIFYPSVMSSETNDLLHESVEEHLAVKRVLADLLTMDLSSDEFAAKLSVLKEQVSHHAHEEEEGRLFPKLRASLDADERAALGNEVLALFEQLLPKHPAQNVPAEITQAAPLPNVR